MKRLILPIISLVVLLIGVIFLTFQRGPRPVAGKGQTGEKVVIGVPNWPSAKAKSYILKTIIEDNLGLEVEMQNGSNAVIFEAMSKGAMHVHPETWSPNHDSWIKKYANEEKTIKISAGKKGIAKQNICVTEGTAKRTGIRQLTELTDSEMAKKFDTDGDGKGDIWIGAVGWGSTPVERIRAKSYGYDVTMNLKVMDEALALAEVDAAVAKKQNIVFFCYSPHHIFTLHKLVPLAEPQHDPSKWKVIAPTDDPNWLESSYAAVAWKEAYIGLHYSISLERSHPQVAKFFSQVGFATSESSAMSYALAVEKISPDQYARQWVSKHPSLVDSWLR